METELKLFPKNKGELMFAWILALVLALSAPTANPSNPSNGHNRTDGVGHIIVGQV